MSEDRKFHIIGLTILFIGMLMGVALLFGICVGLGWLLYTISISAHMPFVLMLKFMDNNIVNWGATGFTALIGITLVAGVISHWVEVYREPQAVFGMPVERKD